MFLWINQSTLSYSLHVTWQQMLLSLLVVWCLTPTFTHMSAISWREQILLINLDTYKILRTKTFLSFNFYWLILYYFIHGAELKRDIIVFCVFSVTTLTHNYTHYNSLHGSKIWSYLSSISQIPRNCIYRFPCIWKTN